MSSISASGSLFQYFQSISNTSSSTPSTATAISSPVVTPDVSTDPGESGAGQVNGGHHHGHHGHGQLFQKIQSAVTSALQSAQSDPSADPNQTIEDAISQVLQGNGSASGATPTDGTDPSATDPTTGTAVAQTSDSASQRQAFAQLLQSVGVNAQQFHQDFLSALSDARNGNVDPSTALSSFPPGSLVDTTA